MENEVSKVFMSKRVQTTDPASDDYSYLWLAKRGAQGLRIESKWPENRGQLHPEPGQLCHALLRIIHGWTNLSQENLNLLVDPIFRGVYVNNSSEDSLTLLTGPVSRSQGSQGEY